jgi:Tfp pilus assembly protein FimT
MTERKHVFIAQCRSCNKTFQGTLGWEDSTGDIRIENSTLLPNVQKHHIANNQTIGNHHNYSLFLNEQQLDEHKRDVKKFPGPFGYLIISSQCNPIGAVYDWKIDEQGNEHDKQKNE